MPWACQIANRVAVPVKLKVSVDETVVPVPFAKVFQLAKFRVAWVGLSGNLEMSKSALAAGSCGS